MKDMLLEIKFDIYRFIRMTISFLAIQRNYSTFLMFGLLLVIATLESAVYAETIQLLPEYVNVLENTHVTLTCSKENGKLVETKWTNSQIGEEAVIYNNGEQCITTRFLQTSNLFDGICNGDGTHSLLLKRVDRTQFGAVWQCKELLLSSNQVIIKELVPVVSVDIYLPTETYMKENHTQTIRCKPSACQPQPTIRWFFRSPINRAEYNITDNITQISSDNENGLVVSEGLLYLLPNRSLTGWTLACEAWNNIQSPAVLSKEVVLNISSRYPVHLSFLMIGLLLVMTTLELGGVNADTIQLLPKYVNVVENASVTLTCSNDNEAIWQARWTNTQIKGEEASIYLLGSVCRKTRFLQYSNFFDGVCNDDGTYSVVLKRVNRTQFGAVWQCADLIYSSNRVTIKELVPVDSVEIYPPTETYFKENHSKTVRCRPSACRPQPTIRWFLRNPIDRVEYNITDNTTQISSENKDGLVVLEGLLYLYPNRSLNGWTLACAAWNNIQSPAVISMEVVLNISYPPDNGPKIHGYGPDKLYRIIESDRREFSCSITGGNPLANLSWNCFSSKSTTVQVVNRSVISNITWEAVRNQNVCSCESYHIYNGKQAAHVNVDVLYPLTKPFFTINLTRVFDVVNVIQNNTLQISCKSISNPTPGYTWNGPNIFNRLEQTLRITVTHMYDEGQYRCTAENRMVRSDNTVKDGTNTSYINVKMLYPPRKFSFRYGNKNGDVIRDNTINVVKGDSFSIYCDADGNPSPVFKWDNYTDGHFLIITAIRSDVKKTCTATNWMNETLGESLLGLNSATVSISVLYKASVLQFYIGEESTVKSSFTVNETELVTFWCNIESKPPPNATLSHKGEILHVSVSNNSLVYTKTKIQCKDSGMYICSARNKYNYGTPSAKSLTVYVNCSPRPSPFYELKENVKSPIYTSATLRCLTLAFPEPGPSGFTWLFSNGSEWIVLTDSYNIAISSTSSQSSLTIINVTQSDFGQYFLRITNSVGVYEQKFSLEPQSSITVSKCVAYSSNTVAFIAVGVCTFVATLIIVGSVLTAYRFIRRRRKLSYHVHTDNRRHNEKSGPGNGSAQLYEGLDESRKERDQYSQLPASFEQQVIPSGQTEAGSISNSETQHTIQDYINIRI